MADQGKRENFRIEYPPAERPKLILPGREYLVVDLSERGVKFMCDPRVCMRLNDTFKGKILFKDGKHVPVSGTVLRVADDKRSCVASLVEGVPLAKMMEEHRVILQKYKPKRDA